MQVRLVSVVIHCETSHKLVTSLTALHPSALGNGSGYRHKCIMRDIPSQSSGTHAMKPMYRVEVQSHPVRGKAFSKRY